MHNIAYFKLSYNKFAQRVDELRPDEHSGTFSVYALYRSEQQGLHDVQG
jgi:hypothetical protein